MTLSNDIKKRLSHFFGWYSDKVNFLKKLHRERKFADELVLLSCCYIDQLGNCLFPNVESGKRGFELILKTHSGESKEFSLISVADLVCDLLYVSRTRFYIFPQPGRVQIHTDTIKPIIRLIDQIEIPLTEKAVHRFLMLLYANLKSKFRLHPYQTLKKKSSGDEEEIINSIMELSSEFKKIEANVTNEKIRNLIKEYSYVSILYREFRSKSVHEIGGVLKTPEFWSQKRPYFMEVRHELVTRRGLKLTFPANFLINCLETSIKCSEKAIIGKGMLPPPIWNMICNAKEFRFMDVDDIGEAKPIKLKID